MLGNPCISYSQSTTKDHIRRPSGIKGVEIK
jgi:hypothetical protein